MFRMHHLLRLFGSIALATTIAIVGARSARAAHDTWYANAVSSKQAKQSVPFITDTLGGNGHAKVQTVEGLRIITDTLGGNGHPYNGSAYVYGGASQQLSQAIQSAGKSPSPASAPVLIPSNSGFDWGNVEIGAGSAATLMLLLVGGMLVRSNRHRVAAA